MAAQLQLPDICIYIYIFAHVQCHEAHFSETRLGHFPRGLGKGNLSEKDRWRESLEGCGISACEGQHSMA